MMRQGKEDLVRLFLGLECKIDEARMALVHLRTDGQGGYGSMQDVLDLGGG